VLARCCCCLVLPFLFLRGAPMSTIMGKLQPPASLWAQRCPRHAFQVLRWRHLLCVALRCLAALHAHPLRHGAALRGGRCPSFFPPCRVALFPWRATRFQTATLLLRAGTSSTLPQGGQSFWTSKPAWWQQQQQRQQPAGERMQQQRHLRLHHGRQSCPWQLPLLLPGAKRWRWAGPRSCRTCCRSWGSGTWAVC